jgi:hypothetical protein
VLIGALLGFAFTSAPAVADTTTSTNWSGYSSHKSGVEFRQVTASWTQPTAVCTGGSPSYSAIWVGLGGYSSYSNALEQIGTELDCSASGNAVSSAWYELVPAPSRTVRLTVRSGDRMRASVKVVGHQVTLRLTDSTSHKQFSRRVTVTSVDVSSADWIVEAPSECVNANLCQTLPLTDFGSVRFTAARAQTSAGRTAAVSSRAWGTTKIMMAALGRRFIASTAGSDSTPSPLQSAGTSFEVDYSQSAVSAPAPPSFAKYASTGASSDTVQPGGRRR